VFHIIRQINIYYFPIYKIHRSVYITDTECVLCGVENEFLFVLTKKFSLQKRMSRICPQFSFLQYIFFNFEGYIYVLFGLESEREMFKPAIVFRFHSEITLHCHQDNHGHLFTYKIIPCLIYHANEFKLPSTKEQKESSELKLTWPRT
jgi:hypothetical protein